MGQNRRCTGVRSQYPLARLYRLIMAGAKSEMHGSCRDSFSRSQIERGIAVSAVQVQAGCLPHKLLDYSFRSIEFGKTDLSRSKYIKSRIMKQNLVVLMLGAIVIGGLPSCSFPLSGPPTPPATTAQPTIKVSGSSSTVDFVHTLKIAYESDGQTSSVTLLEPVQSESILAGIKQGLVDVGVISKILKPADHNDPLVARVVVQDALLVATHPSVTGVQNLTTEDLKAIYSGSITNWQQLGGPDATIVVLDRPEDESAKRLLRRHYLGAELPNAPRAVVFRKEGELIQAIQSTPYSIGAFSLAYAISHKLPVNRLSLNDIEPTLEQLKAGRYPMVRKISLVWHKNAAAATQSFVRYVFSPAGTKVLEQSGFAPITPVAATIQQ
jgi:phosphate transport system substrate-binding protein